MDKRRFEDGTVLVGFELPAAVSAATVSVCGDFNGWAAQSHPLHRAGDGSFRTEIPLPAGDRWRFRYLLDGQRWENDWAADDYVPNGLGGDNSVVDLTDTQSLPIIDAATPAAAGSHGGSQDAATPAAAATDDDPAGAARHPGLLRRWWRRLTGTGEDDAVRVNGRDGELVGSGR